MLTNLRRYAGVFHDDTGFVITMELVLIVTIVVLGTLVALTAVRDAVVAELTDVARSVQEVNQSYRYSTVGRKKTARADGSDYLDARDPGQPRRRSPNGVGRPRHSWRHRDNCVQFSGPADEQR